VIKRAAPSDTERIMRLVYKQYGELNYDRTLYDKDKLFDGIKTEKYRFWLAEYDGQDAGLVCLKAHPHFIGTYEGCTLSVLPEYRRHGIAKKLSDTMQSTFDSVRAASIFYSILTVRTLEEEREYENGCKPTGFALDRFLFDKGAVNLSSESLPKRRHHIFLVLPLDKKQTSKLFIPPQIENFVRNIYSDLGVTIGDTEAEPMTGEIVDYPENAYREYYSILPDVKTDENIAANLFLDMTDRRTPERYKQLLRDGWRFTGIKPLQTTSEYIIMHKGDINEGLNESKTLTAFLTQKEDIRRIGNIEKDTL
jgi:GNAT superfamily N-acetyltransferase